MRYPLLLCVAALLTACSGGPPASRPPAGASAKSDNGLEFSVSSIAGDHKVGEPIPMTLHYLNGTGYPVQVSPHINVIVKNGRDEQTWRVDLPIDRPIRLANGGTFEWKLDLARAVKLRGVGEYDVTVGHDNSVSSDTTNWVGTIYTQPQHVVIR